MKCAICKKDKDGAEHVINISGHRLDVFICNQCESEKGEAYVNFFDNIRENIEAERSQ